MIPTAASTSGCTGATGVAASPAKELLLVVVAAPFTAPDDDVPDVAEVFAFVFLLAVVTACLMTLAAFGVAFVVQYHLPFASAHV